MNKKLYIGLASLLAIAAFVVMPATSEAACAAPACPHIYKNGSIGSEGKKVRYITWGTLKLNNTTLGTVECHTAHEGYLENPVGGVAAKGQVQAFALYECVDETCTKVLGGSAIRPKAENLPWVTEVFENAKREFREKIGSKGKPPEEGVVAFNVDCVGVATPLFAGELDPLILNNGTAIGSGPNELKFETEKTNPEAHDLESELGGRGEVESGSPSIKFEGYGTEELLEVKNP
jgi:hypothetical protein